MKEFRAKVIVTNENPYKDIDNWKQYDKHQFNRIVNHNFNEWDKVWMWKLIQNSFPGLKKEIEVFRRSNPRSKFFDGKEVVIYDEESIYTNKTNNEDRIKKTPKNKKGNS